MILDSRYLQEQLSYLIEDTNDHDEINAYRRVINGLEQYHPGNQDVSIYRCMQFLNISDPSVVTENIQYLYELNN